MNKKPNPNLVRYATVRKDLLDTGETVPVGESYYGKAAPLRYRWLHGEVFQVEYNGIWEYAESIDWDFGVHIKPPELVGREADIQKLVKAVLEMNPIHLDNQNGIFVCKCIICGKFLNDGMHDIKHDLDCAYLIAKNLSTTLK